MKITSILIFSLIAVMASAQPGPFPQNKMSNDEIIQMQTREMVTLLDLNRNDQSRFIKEYTAFRKEIDEVAQKARSSQKTNNESDIDKAIQKNFEISETILRIRKKYYLIFKEYMKPSQIQMMYFLENEAGRNMQKGPGGPGGPDGPAMQGGPKGPGFPGGGPKGPGRPEGPVWPKAPEEPDFPEAPRRF